MAKEVENQEKGERFVCVVFCWEIRYNDPSSAPIKAVEELPEDCKIQILTQQTASLNTVLNLGVLWPLKDFEKELTKVLGRKPVATDLMNIDHNGEKIKGVLRDSKYGNPTGTYVVTSKSSLSHVKSVEQENSATAVRGAQQCTDTFGALLKRIKVASTLQTHTDGNDEADVLNLQCKYKQQSGDILDNLWTNPFQQGKVKAAPDPNKPKQAKSHKAKDPMAKRQLEYNESEQVLLRVAQTLSLTLTKFTSVTLVSLKKLQKDLKNRMSSNLMEYYRQDLMCVEGDSQNQSKLTGRSGTEILEGLTTATSNIDAWVAIKEVVTQNASGPETHNGHRSNAKPHCLGGRGGIGRGGGRMRRKRRDERMEGEDRRRKEEGSGEECGGEIVEAVGPRPIDTV